MTATAFETDRPVLRAPAVRARTRSDTYLGRALSWARAHAPGAGRWLRAAATRIRTVALTVAGLGCVVAAAWLVAVPLGLLAGGLSLLALEYLSTPTEPQGRR